MSHGSGAENDGVAIVEKAAQLFVKGGCAAEERLDPRREERAAGIEYRFECECQANQRRQSSSSMRARYSK